MAASIQAVNQEQLNALCAELRSGTSVRKYLEDNKPGFCRGTFYEWLDLHATKEQTDQYARALDSSAESDFDDVRYIADTETDASLARVKIDACKWIAGKKKPKKYGEKAALELSGNLGLKHDIAKLSDEELDAELSEFDSSTKGAPPSTS